MTISADRLHVLPANHAQQLQEYVLALAERYTSTQDPRLAESLPVLAAEIPADVRAFVREFAFADSRGYAVVRGNLVDNVRIGPTPSHWQKRTIPGSDLPEELLVMLYGALLGEPFGWRNEQDSRLVHDVLPVREYENANLGIGSRETLSLHTEAAFHPLRADYLLLFCLRNPSRVATTVAELRLSDLSASHVKVLFEERFPIQTPPQFIEGETGQTTEPIAILYGDPDDPYLRVDPYVMGVPETPAARAAFDRLTTSLARSTERVTLTPGDILIINNHRMVHGRQSFTPSYDGSDRWLKRVNVTRDLQKSRALRASATARVI